MTSPTTTPEKTICVFCGSSFGNDPKYAKHASELGEKLAKQNWGLVYGGGTTGLMGAVAKSCSDNGGYVHGIIPSALVARERIDPEQLNKDLKSDIDNHNGWTPISDEYGKSTIVPDMHTRKRLMGEEADAFIALPGGYGTLEEIMEVITWSQLGIHSKPIIFFNIDGFYDELLSFVQKSIKSGFISEKNGEIIVVGNSSDEVIKQIANYIIPEGRYNLVWENLGTSNGKKE